MTSLFVVLQKSKFILLGMMFAILVGGWYGAMASQPASAACGSFLTFPAWYDGLVDGDCNITAIGGGSGQVDLQKFIWTIAFNIVEILLQIVAYVTGFYVLYGGFQFITSTGSPDGTAKARKTIINALIGLVLAIAAVGIVNLISGAIK